MGKKDKNKNKNNPALDRSTELPHPSVEETVHQAGDGDQGNATYESPIAVPEPQLPLPSLVEAVGTWDALRKEVVDRQAELSELLEAAETIRQFLTREYGVSVAPLGTPIASVEITAPNTYDGPVLASGAPSPAESVTPGPAEGETYTPPPQGPVYDPVLTGTISESQVDQIRKDASIPGADSASFGAGVAGMLESVRRSFSGGR